ncbi:hypothetical protein [Nocardioides euryhalodurans]|uniref:Uncharacterized protein n=1 Tax=Nocardioides euryhalodurans TaxID=2518370 RepID=A0A4P7GJN3_9ACTN|nr:hypothetical protein [Nocardioides euryhalodurans]QBR92206.1 hypothetical protein EXE57_07835 [Nocardioides euryhalodurans]
MRTRLVSALLVAALSLPLGAAHGATVSVTDPAGDGSAGERLDVLDVTLRNRDRAVVVTTTFVAVGKGSVAVGLDARRPPGQVVLVARRRPGPDRAFLVTEDGRRRCAGLLATWDTEAETLRLRMPSRCFRGGAYRALRMRAITEELSAGDIDLVRRFRWSDWVRRG